MIFLSVFSLCTTLGASELVDQALRRDAFVEGHVEQVIEVKAYRELTLGLRASQGIDEAHSKRIKIKLKKFGESPVVGEHVLYFLDKKEGEFWLRNGAFEKFHIRRVGKKEILMNSVKIEAQMGLDSFYRVIGNKLGMTIHRSSRSVSSFLGRKNRYKNILKENKQKKGGRSLASVSEIKSTQNLASIWLVFVLGFLVFFKQMFRRKSQ